MQSGGGSWFRARSRDSSIEINSDLLKLRELPEADCEWFLSQVRIKTRRACDGRLRPNRPRDVRAVGGKGTVAEIRFHNLEGTSEADEFRLYYAEPESVDGLLLAISFKRKHIKNGRDNQSADIESAETRYAVGAGRYWGLKSECPEAVPPASFMSHIESEEIA